jgi:hypothetical protein
LNEMEKKSVVLMLKDFYNKGIKIPAE